MLDANVKYFCPCYRSPADLPLTDYINESNEDDVDHADDADDELHLDQRTSYALFPIEYLYFCDDCHVHRCPRCVIEEVVSVFCPNCLFEVPGKDGISESHCRRNCFRCPLCLVAMIVVPDLERGHAIKCPHCQWSSADHGFSFPKASGLPAQLAAQKPDSRQHLFDMVRGHFANVQATDGTEYESEGARLLRQYRQTIEQPVKRDFEPEELRDEEEEAHQDAPQSIPLRSKRTKRCRQCRLLLVKPDSKPMSTAFRSRLYANRVLPTISFQPVSTYTLIPLITSQWLLKLVNPMPVPCKITLGTKTTTEDGTHVVILCPELTLGANSDVWNTTASTTTTTSTTSASDSVSSNSNVTHSTNGELQNIGKNFASVPIELVVSSTRSGTTNPLKIAVFVQIQYRVQDEDLPRHRDTRRAPVSDGTSETTGNGERQRQRESKVDDVRQIGVWVVLEARKGSW